MEQTSTVKKIMCAIGRLNAKEDLRTISQALRHQADILDEREREEKDRAIWEQVPRWALGTTVFCHGEIMVMGDQRFRFRRGERFIVHSFMPRAHAVCFELPDRPDWTRRIYRANCRDLKSLNFHTELWQAASTR